MDDMISHSSTRVDTDSALPLACRRLEKENDSRNHTRLHEAASVLLSVIWWIAF